MEKIAIVIETVKGSNTKYKFDPVTGSFKVKKAIALGMVFPYDFGFIPGTKGEDGDPLDAMMISMSGSFTGCSINGRLIGALLAEQSEAGKKFRNDRYFFVPDYSLQFDHVRSMQDLGRKHNEQLKDFFINYNKAEGKTFKPLKLIAAPAAMALIEKSRQP